ncbi:MAG: OB-fold nucleic acid binding domain-containing protein [Candidatus Dojkabacteria bacterium]|nr:OB-fold nucleic acid binding domain-containing protein [Candidatus Dojkabacteria bacterium]
MKNPKYILIDDAVNNINQKVIVKGWVASHRAMGKICFIDLRDSTGVIQCFAIKDTLKNFDEIKKITIESVVSITGVVKQRPKEQYNQNLDTGSIEIEINEFNVLNLCKSIPMPVHTDGYEISEEVRLKYRYIDLRRSRVHNNLIVRSQFIRFLRDFLIRNKFIEIETPLLSAPTMEGARDFLVPSSMQKGKFYALPQSPQQYKQLLMCAGFYRYFQFAKCLRDENLRADRGFEFTQVDLEFSFITKEEIMQVVEALIIEVVEKLGKKIKQKPFPKFSYFEVIEKFGDDKFDLRNDQEKEEGILAFAWVEQFPFFKQVNKDDKAEIRDGKSGWTFTHNPFSMPIEEHLEWHINGINIDKIITQQYDLVCNGFEVGGGSIRAHKPEILKATYKIMGYTDQEIEQSIGHMLEALSMGAPPHGGIALGLDRLVALIQNEKSIKEVIAFPMTYTGNIAVMNAPINVDQSLLEEDLGLKVIV